MAILNTTTTTRTVRRTFDTAGRVVEEVTEAVEVVEDGAGTPGNDEAD